MVSVAQQPLPRPRPLQLPSPITQSWSLCPCVTLSVSAFIERLALPGTGPAGGNRLGVGGGSAPPNRLLCRWVSVSTCLHVSVCFGLPHPELLRPGPPRHLPGLFPLRCQMQRPAFYVVVHSYIFLWRLQGECQVGTCERQQLLHAPLGLLGSQDLREPLPRDWANFKAFLPTATGLGQRAVRMWFGWCFPQELGAPGLRTPGGDREAVPQPFSGLLATWPHLPP